MTSTRRDRQAASLARGGSLNLAGAAANGLLQLALVVIVTNGISPADAGLFFAATSAFLIFGAVAEMGAGTGVLRWLPAYLATGRVADVATCLRIAILSVLTMGTVLAAVVFVTAPQLAQLVADGDDATALVPVLRVLAVFIPVAAAYEVILAGTRAYGTMRPSVLVDKVGRMAAQPLGALLVVMLGAGIVGLALAWSAPYVIAIVVAARCLATRVRRRRTDFRVPQTERRPWRVVALEFWRYTSARSVARICQVALQRVDIILVAILRSPAEAAIYTAATRLIVVGQLGIQAVVRVLQPTISRLIAVGDHESAQDAFRTTTTWSVAITWPVYLASIAVAPLLLSLFGEQYADGEMTLIILSLAMLFATAAGPVDVMLLMAGRSALSLGNTVTALAVNVGLNFALIPRFGILGAAVSWAAAIVVANGLAFVQVRRTLLMTAGSPALTWVAMSAVAFFGALPWLVGLVSDAPLVIVSSLVVATGAYALTLWWRREVLGLPGLARALRRGSTSGGAAGEPDPVTAGLAPKP